MTSNTEWTTVASVGGVSVLESHGTYALTTGGLQSNDRAYIYASPKTLRALADAIEERKQANATEN